MITRRRHDPVTDLLRSTLRLHRKVHLLADRASRLAAAAQATTPHYSAVPGGGKTDQRKDSLWLAATEAGEELFRAWQDYWAQETKVHRILQQMQNLPQRAILQYRYYEGLSWPEVQTKLESMGLYYSERHVFNLHGDALQEARRLWEEGSEGREDSDRPNTDE